MHSFTIFLNVLTKLKNTVVIIINTHGQDPRHFDLYGKGKDY